MSLFDDIVDTVTGKKKATEPKHADPDTGKQTPDQDIVDKMAGGTPPDDGQGKRINQSTDHQNQY